MLKFKSIQPVDVRGIRRDFSQESVVFPRQMDMARHIKTQENNVFLGLLLLDQAQ